VVDILWHWDTPFFNSIYNIELCDAQNDIVIFSSPLIFWWLYRRFMQTIPIAWGLPPCHLVYGGHIIIGRVFWASPWQSSCNWGPGKKFPKALGCIRWPLLIYNHGRTASMHPWQSSCNWEWLYFCNKALRMFIARLWSLFVKYLQ